MTPGKAPLHQTTDPGDLHAQIQQMIAAAQGMAPMPPLQPQMAAPGGMPAQVPQMPMPQGMPPPPMQSMGGPPAPQGGMQAPAMPQPGGSPQNVQKAMLAKAIRGG